MTRHRNVLVRAVVGATAVVCLVGGLLTSVAAAAPSNQAYLYEFAQAIWEEETDTHYNVSFLAILRRTAESGDVRTTATFGLSRCRLDELPCFVKGITRTIPQSSFEFDPSLGSAHVQIGPWSASWERQIGLTYEAVGDPKFTIGHLLGGRLWAKAGVRNYSLATGTHRGRPLGEAIPDYTYLLLGTDTRYSP